MGGTRERGLGMADSVTQRQQAAAEALSEIRAGMIVGLGTGRTAALFVRLLGAAVRSGLAVTGVASSERTAELARAEGIPLVSLDDAGAIDLVVDGADEIDPKLRMIKGGGGALLREKLLAVAARRMIVIAEEAKMVAMLGAYALPIEVVRFGTRTTCSAVERACASLGLTGSIAVREADGRPFVTDEGHHLLDASLGAIPDPEALAAALDAVTGVVEHGLFLVHASTVILGAAPGPRRYDRA